MKRQRIVLAVLGTILTAAVAACGGTPTASDLGLAPGLNVESGGMGSGHAAGGFGMGSGSATGGHTFGSGAVMEGGQTGTGGTTAPTDTTKRIGFIGSGG